MKKICIIYYIYNPEGNFISQHDTFRSDEYQRNILEASEVFHDLIGFIVEAYITHILVKSMEHEDHIKHLKKYFDRLR